MRHILQKKHTHSLYGYYYVYYLGEVYIYRKEMSEATGTIISWIKLLIYINIYFLGILVCRLYHIIMGVPKILDDSDTCQCESY